MYEERKCFVQQPPIVVNIREDIQDVIIAMPNLMSYWLVNSILTLFTSISYNSGQRKQTRKMQ